MPRPLPILFCIPNFTTAGTGRAMLDIVERLDRARFAPAVCVLRRGGALEDVVERAGLPLLEAPFCVPIRPRRTLLARARRAAQAFRPHRFRIWHSFHYLDDYSEPLIARWAGARAWVYTKKNMSWGGRGWLLRSHLATRIVTLNREMLARFFAGPPLRGRARCIPRGVDLARFAPGVPPRLGLRARLGLGPQAFPVACVAHLVPIKGQATLIRAAAGVPDVHLLLAGAPRDADYARELAGLAGRLGMTERVHFLGAVDDVPALLSEAEAFVLPTEGQGEAFGVALIEALAAGLPCVAGETAGPAEILVRERDGLLVPPGDPQALAEALRRLRAEPALRARLGHAARRRARAFSIEREVAAHAALYAELGA